MTAQADSGARPSVEPEEAATSTGASRTRILFVINSLGGGGAERVMATLLANSRDRLADHDFALAVLDDGPRAYRVPHWLKIFQLDCRGGTLSSVSAIDRLVGQFDPDLTVSFLTRANLASAMAMMKRRRRWIISERTSTPAHLGSALRQLATGAMMGLVYPRASRVIAVSAGVADKLARKFGVGSSRIEVIPNPVDSSALEAAADEADGPKIDEPYVIALGRLVGVKNFPLLIRGFAKSGLACRLAIAGDGPDREALASLVSELRIADRVTMTGWLSNPYPALRNASVFALSSNVEGFPNALVEALALGVPVVATNCVDGPSEILASCSTKEVSGLTVAEAGILTPVGDVDSYGRALQLAFEQSVRDRIIAGGRKRVKDYSAPAIAAKYWDVISGELSRAEVGRRTSSRIGA